MKKRVIGGCVALSIMLSAGFAGSVYAENKKAAYCPEAYTNICALGAVGDGVTDCTDAFTSAATGGQAIFVPAGVYRITNTIKIDSGTIVGAGEGESRILMDTEDPMVPIVLAGSYSTIRDITLGFAKSCITGNEGKDERVAIFTGNAWSLQRSASLRRVTLENVGTGVLSPDINDKLLLSYKLADTATAFSVTYEDVSVRQFTYRGFDLSAECRTGNVYRNLYFTTSYKADSALYCNGEESETVMDGVIIENMTVARPVFMFGMRALSAGSITLNGVESSDGSPLVTFSCTNGLIDSLSVIDCNARGTLVSLARGDYYIENHAGHASQTSYINIKTLNLSNIAKTSLADSPVVFFGRSTGTEKTDNGSGKYTVEIDSYSYSTDRGDETVYAKLPVSGSGLDVTGGYKG